MNNHQIIEHLKYLMIMGIEYHSEFNMVALKATENVHKGRSVSFAKSQLKSSAVLMRQHSDRLINHADEIELLAEKLT